MRSEDDQREGKSWAAGFSSIPALGNPPALGDESEAVI